MNLLTSESRPATIVNGQILLQQKNCAMPSTLEQLYIKITSSPADTIMHINYSTVDSLPSILFW